MISIRTAAIVSALVFGTGPAIAGDFYNRTTDVQKIAWMDRGMEAVRAQLKDPASAKFESVMFSRAGGVPMTCGRVNAKNSFGGYGGFERFVSAGSAETTALESQVRDFGVVWQKFCR